MKAKFLLQNYIEGWKKGDAEQILATLDDDCLIIESHGPMYRGKKMVSLWIADWFENKNRVDKWEITSFYECGNHFVSEWVFAYESKQEREAFEGITIGETKNGKIVQIREYRATSIPFLWNK